MHTSILLKPPDTIWKCAASTWIKPFLFIWNMEELMVIIRIKKKLKKKLNSNSLKLPPSSSILIPMMMFNNINTISSSLINKLCMICCNRLIRPRMYQIYRGSIMNNWISIKDIWKIKKYLNKIMESLKRLQGVSVIFQKICGILLYL